MKGLAISLSCLLLAGAVFGGDLPSAVKHTVMPSGEHRYEVSGLYVKSPQDVRILSESGQKEIPDCTSLTVDPAKATMVFVTTKAVTDLKHVVDHLAWGGGTVPYWEELEIRDRKSPLFDEHLYTVALQQALPWPEDRAGGPGLLAVTDQPGQLTLTFYSRLVHEGDQSFLLDYVLAKTNGTYTFKQSGDRRWISWRELEPKIKDISTWSAHPLRYAPGKVGKVAINRTTAFCMCHNRFALRVFDSTGCFIWEDQTNVYGAAFVAVADLTGDGTDEIVVYQEEHGKTHFTVFERKPEVEAPDKAPEATR